jgi:PAS domain S-box-containing protein
MRSFFVAARGGDLTITRHLVSSMPGHDPRLGHAQSEILLALVDRISAMVAYWDVDQRCRFANRAYERWFGVKPEALIGTHIRDLLGPLYTLNLPYIEGALRGEPQEFEREIPDPAGGPSRHSLANYIPDVVDGAVRGFFVLVTDISEVKRAQLALRESEALLRLTIDEAPIGMALVALDGRFLRVNHQLCEILGYTAEELTTKTFQDVTHPEDLEADPALAGQLMRGEMPRYQLEKRYVRKDGAVVDIMLSGSVLRGRDGAPRHFVAQIEEITERKRLAKELRLSEARSSGILAISADAIITIDQDQRITMFNDGAVRMFGHAKSEVLGQPLEMLMPERFRARHREHVAAFAAGGDVARRMGERRLAIFGLRKNGEEFPADAAISMLDIDGKRILTVSLRDVTVQKRIEKEQRFLAEVGPVLASSLDYEETLSRIAELAVRELADLCIVDDVEDDAAVRRLKVASRDPARAWVCELLGQVRLDRQKPYLLRQVVETGRAVLLRNPSAEAIDGLAQDEAHLRALRAAEIHSLVAVPLVAHGQLLGAIALISSSPSRLYDEADVRLAEELARRAALSIENARLFQEARRATAIRDEVLGIVAHDLRNPLNSILMHATLIQRREGGPDRRSPHSAEAIAQAAHRMNTLIQDLLDVSSMEAGHLSVDQARVPAGELIAEAVEAQRALAASSGIALRADVANDVPAIWADRGRILQVFENLIGNAFKFTAPGGRVTVGAASCDEGVRFWVADDGVGIAPEHIPHLFERFWQARKGRRHGAGLGLPIVKGVVEAHGGRVGVESSLGQGTTITFTLPAARQATEQGGEAEAAPA